MNAIDFLDGQHAAHRFLGQDEDRDSAWMANNGHPFAEDYWRHRSFFDALAYAGGIGARYVAFHGVRNFVKYQAPKLVLSWTPLGFDGFDAEISPMRDNLRWTQYLQAAARHGWPSGCKPELYSGRWTIQTDIKELLDDFRKTGGSAVELIEPGYWLVNCDNPSESSMERLFRLTKTHFGSASLPPPTALWSNYAIGTATIVPASP